MREQLLNHRVNYSTPFKKLRKLLVLFTLLVVPLGAMAQDLYIAGTQVTASGPVEGLSGVSYDVSTHTLTLTDATINGGIEYKGVAYSPLTINIKGVCSVRV